MNKQGTARLALALFAFGLSFSLSALAADNPCVICETTFEKCLADDILTDQKCLSNYNACMDRGDGRHPCPR